MVDAIQQNNEVGDRDNNEVMREAQRTNEKKPLSDRENRGAMGENDGADEDQQPTVSVDAQNTATEGENERDATPSSNANLLEDDQNDQEENVFESQIYQFDVELGSALKSSERLKDSEVRTVAFDVEDEIDLSENHDSVRSLPRTLRPSLSDFRASPIESSHRTFIQHNQRLSLSIDLETGKDGGSRAQCAMVRQPEERHAQCRRRLNMNKLKRLSNPFWATRKHEEQGDQEIEKPKKRRSIKVGAAFIPKDEKAQYRLVSVDTSEPGGRFGINPGVIYEEDGPDNGRCCGLHPNQFVTSYLFWAFRSSFMAVLLSAAVWFFTLTFMFGWFIYFIGIRNPKCIHVNGQDFGSERDFGEMFMDAYTLSWTTFSTVGYGLVSPATSATVMVNATSTTPANQNIRVCTGITFLLTLESFVGILIASFWGAIFLSKLTRISSFAQVTFSDPILIRFGSGVGPAVDDDAQSSDDESKEEKEERKANTLDPSESNLALPVLEFRVINRLQGRSKGEIIDASMNIVASVDESQVAVAVKDGSRTIRRKPGKKSKAIRKVGRKINKHTDEDEKAPDYSRTRSTRIQALLGTNRKARSLEDPAGELLAKKSFAKLEIESQEHPFFKRVWLARHVLNQESPLLKQDAKELIRLNNGRWPRELNSPEAVRASVAFDQIIVSLSGTSNADANSVYAQKIYDYIDLCVGYRFCNVLFRDENGCLTVDPRLVNDVVEQTGGGGEDLHNRVHENHISDIFIL